jgi:hypothetical protein
LCSHGSQRTDLLEQAASQRVHVIGPRRGGGGPLAAVTAEQQRDRHGPLQGLARDSAGQAEGRDGAADVGRGVVADVLARAQPHVLGNGQVPVRDDGEHAALPSR